MENVLFIAHSSGRTVCLLLPRGNRNFSLIYGIELLESQATFSYGIHSCPSWSYWQVVLWSPCTCVITEMWFLKDHFVVLCLTF